MSIIPDIKLPDSVDHAVENLTKPVTTNAGTTFGDLWFLVMGGISHAAEKRRIKYAYEAEKFRRDTEARILGIPEDDLKEPNTQIATQALEQAKYCVEEETLRKMFSELIASSMMKSRESIVHPSFATLLSQLSPADAQALLLFKDKSLLPLIRIISSDKGSYNVLIDNIWCVNQDLESINESQTTLNSLARLGLIEINHNEWITDDTVYDGMLTPGLENYARMIAKALDIVSPNITIKKGYVGLTAYGVNFISCVIPQ